MAYDSKTERLISIKKLAGKAHTSNDKGLSNEALSSGITATSETIFGSAITATPSDASLYTISGFVEYIRFPVTFIAGSDTSDGRHGFQLKLPADYESNSSNSKAGTFPFVNNQVINVVSGALQMVPPSFAAAYEAKAYYGGNTTKNSGTRIPILDTRDWYLDYFNGIFFQQDPPGTGDHSNNPDFIEGFLYIGDMLNDVISSGASSYSRTAVASTLTASVNSKIIGISASAAVEIRLPSASNYTSGQHFVVKDEGGNCNVNNITIRASGSQTIDGNNSIVLESPYAAVNIYSDGTSKFFIY
tara:strand:- start:2308 stop:3213 length:906 start_codon:yes stop_codon:yes gene_type:complete